MTILLAILALCQSAKSTASVEVPLSTTADNQPALTLLLSWSPPGSTITLPTGEWPVDSSVVVMKKIRIRGAGIRSTTIYGRGEDWGGAVFVVGNYSNDIKVNGVSFEDLAVDQRGRSPTKTHTCINIHGDDLAFTRVLIKGSQYEGIAGYSAKCSFTDCVGEDCGCGGPAYPLRLAAFNVHIGAKHLRTVVRRCGQGFEIGTNCVLDSCDVGEERPDCPCLGANIGSHSWGIHNVLIRNSSFRCRDAIGVGNGNGRCSKIIIENCLIVDGAMTFMGGKSVNAVPGNPYEGPDTYGSRISGNVFIIHKANNGTLMYATGLTQAEGDVFGREPLTISRNVFVNLIPASEQQMIPAWIEFAGKIVAKTICSDNVFLNTEAAPNRGDVCSRHNHDNLAVAGFPSLLQVRNLAVKPDGSQRPVVSNIWGSAQ